MASSLSAHRAFLLPLLLLISLTHLSMAASSFSRKLSSLVQPSLTPLTYHNGPLLRGDVPISILWYGKFTPTQKSIISDFLLSLNPITHHNGKVKATTPSVSQWWKAIDDTYLNRAKRTKKSSSNRILLAGQLSDDKCSLGKSLKRSHIATLAAKAGTRKGGIALVLTAADVAVEGFCMSRCGSHGSDRKSGSAYVWVGNSAIQCPGQCAWPFHQPIYGPQSPPLVAPNGDVGMDGVVVNLASLLAGTVTNPFGNGFFQGPKEAPLEAASACTGVYGKGAYPGYAGDLLVDPTSGASYNVNGARGRKYLVPALFDPSTGSCSTMV